MREPCPRTYKLCNILYIAYMVYCVAQRKQHRAWHRHERHNPHHRQKRKVYSVFFFKACGHHKCMTQPLEACTAAALIGLIRLPDCSFDSAWCLVAEVCRSTVDCIDCRCFLSFVFLCGARRLELSPCNTASCVTSMLLRPHQPCRNEFSRYTVSST